MRYRASFILLLMLLGQSCRTIEELSTGHYYVRNEGTLSLRLEAGSQGKPVQLEADSIGPAQKARIFVAREGSGGHVWPSNFFSTFSVYIITAQGDSLIYEGVRNDDWEKRNIGDSTWELEIKF